MAVKNSIEVEIYNYFLSLVSISFKGGRICFMKISDQKENFPIVVLISLSNWEVNVVEYKVQVLFLNEKENTKFCYEQLEELFYTYSFSVTVLI
jgi:hypothetical protein